MVTQERAKELLTYDPETGVFLWKPKPRSHRKNPMAGGNTKNGYVTIRIDYKQYLAHRLAFLFMDGEFPNENVDHINNNRKDNRWCNLRKATSSQNNCNRKRGDIPLGVYECERKGRKGKWYMTKIQKDGKQYSSYFRNLEDAIAWRVRKEEVLFGEFRNRT